MQYIKLCRFHCKENEQKERFFPNEMYISFSSVKADVEKLMTVFYNTFYSVLFQSLFLESGILSSFLSIIVIILYPKQKQKRIRRINKLLQTLFLKDSNDESKRVIALVFCWTFHLNSLMNIKINYISNYYYKTFSSKKLLFTSSSVRGKEHWCFHIYTYGCCVF